jgi:hypothetical protein
VLEVKVSGVLDAPRLRGVFGGTNGWGLGAVACGGARFGSARLLERIDGAWSLQHGASVDAIAEGEVCANLDMANRDAISGRWGERARPGTDRLSMSLQTPIVLSPACTVSFWPQGISAVQSPLQVAFLAVPQPRVLATSPRILTAIRPTHPRR